MYVQDTKEIKKPLQNNKFSFTDNIYPIQKQFNITKQEVE